LKRTQALSLSPSAGQRCRSISNWRSWRWSRVMGSPTYVE
jgi:hypothetical protein